MNEGDKVVGYCKCGGQVDCVMVRFSNDTLHAKGKCPQCGKNAYFQTRTTKTLDDIRHMLKGVECGIKGMENLLERDEAVAELERLAARYRREDV